jgi:hypothetical protein
MNEMINSYARNPTAITIAVIFSHLRRMENACEIVAAPQRLRVITTHTQQSIDVKSPSHFSLTLAEPEL